MSTISQTLVWISSAITAVWFVFLALRAGRSWLAWVLAGGLSALVGTTLILGLWEAAFIPRSHEAYVAFRIKSTVVILVVLVILGVSAAKSLRRQPHPPTKTPV